MNKTTGRATYPTPDSFRNGARGILPFFRSFSPPATFPDRLGRCLADSARTHAGMQQCCFSAGAVALWRIESELNRLVRLAEAPERRLPTTVSCRWQAGAGMPSEARYRALAVGLVRACQLYTELEGMIEREEATERLRAAAARVRRRATDAGVAA